MTACPALTAALEAARAALLELRGEEHAAASHHVVALQHVAHLGAQHPAERVSRAVERVAGELSLTALRDRLRAAGPLRLVRSHWCALHSRRPEEHQEVLSWEQAGWLLQAGLAHVTPAGDLVEGRP